MRTTATALLAICTLEGSAHARDREWRLSGAAVGTYAFIGTAESSATVPQVGGALRVGYGLSHLVEIGVRAGVTTSRDIKFEDAMVNVQPGTLLADDLDIEFAADLRLIGGIDWSLRFVRTHPVFGLRAGVLVRYLYNQALVDPAAGGLVEAPGSDTTLLPFIGADLGVEHRFGRAFVAGLIGGLDYGGERYAGGRVTLEFGWHWY